MEPAKFLSLATAGLVATIGAPALVAAQDYQAKSPQIVERNIKGKASESGGRWQAVSGLHDGTAG